MHRDVSTRRFSTHVLHPVSYSILSSETSNGVHWVHRVIECDPSLPFRCSCGLDTVIVEVNILMLMLSRDGVDKVYDRSAND